MSRPNPRLNWDRIGPPKSLSSLSVDELPYVALSFGAIPKVTAFMSKMKFFFVRLASQNSRSSLSFESASIVKLPMANLSAAKPPGGTIVVAIVANVVSTL
jgi:hypothetical protein